MVAVVGSDTRVVSPVFTDLDETPEACTTPPTVTVTSLVTGLALPVPAVTAGPSDGTYYVTLTAADHLTRLDILTIVWVGSVGGAVRNLTQTVEVAGGVYVPTDELAHLRTVPNTGSKMDAVRFWRDAFERLVEQARGVAFVPRLAVETHNVTDFPWVVLRRARPGQILSVTSGGVSVDLSTVTTEALSGRLVGSFGFGSTVEVIYAHGYTTPPPIIQAACKEYVRAMLLTDTSDQQRNVLAFTNLATGEQFRYGTADWSAGRYTGLTQVDDLINAVGDERIPGFA